VKKLLVTSLMLVLISTPALAGICEDISSLAGLIMDVRQKGAPMSTVMGVANEQKDAYRPLCRSIVIDAYESPKYSTESVKAQVISEFTNKYYLACVKSN